VAWLFLLGAIWAVGCSKSGAGGQEASVRQAIMTHLASNSNLNMQAFQTQVTKVNVQGDHAQADVEFHLKDGPGVMQLSYDLEKHGNDWQVVNSANTNGNFAHPMPGANGAGAANPMSDPMQFFHDGTQPPANQGH
jgi:hypothetical protein